MVTVVRQILSAIARCRGKFGVGVVAEVLAGSVNERTQKWGLDELSTFGLLKTYSIKRLIAMLHRVLETGLARQRDPDGVKFRPVVELTPPGISVMRGEQPPPAVLADLLPRRIEPDVTPQRIRVTVQDDQAMTPEVEVRFEALRQLRTRIARSAECPRTSSATIPRSSNWPCWRPPTKAIWRTSRGWALTKSACTARRSSTC